MNDIIVKYNRLNKSARRQVNEFMDFLLNKQKPGKTAPLSTYKTRILKVSVWTEADFTVYNENRELFKKWAIQEW